MPFLSALYTYPIKSCRGISHTQVRLTPRGLAWDRHWMIIDGHDRFVSQREYPGMARIVPTMTETALEVNAPGMAALHIALQRVETGEPRRVSVWRDRMGAIDEGDIAAQWFSEAIGADVRLVRFDETSQRMVDPNWTASETAFTQFADGFPLLVASQDSLDELNGRLMAKGAPTIAIDRFRPNVVVSGFEAYDEDYLDTLAIGDGNADGTVGLRLVKPCTRCPIPTIDQTSGLRDKAWPNEPLDTLSLYRSDPRVDGGLTFGQNAIVIQGEECVLHVGAAVEAEWRFEDEA